MAKPRKPALDLLVYAAVRAAVCLVQAVPLPLSRRFAELLGAVAYRVNRRHREVARDNLRHAFPDWPDARIDRTVRGVYRHFCRVAVEIMMLPRLLHVGNWRDYADLVRGDRILDRLLDDRPLLIVTGHFGNWEMAGFALGLLGFRTHAIARVLDNPHLERFLKRFREKTGQTVIAKKDDFDRLTDVLAAGGAVATLADQDAGPRGQFADFFGRPASTHKAVALLALEFNVPMAVVGVPRVAEPMRYAIVVEDVVWPEEYAGRPDAVKAITQRYTAALERLVRRHPEQYFWLHRRWKSQPAQRKGKKAA